MAYAEGAFDTMLPDCATEGTRVGMAVGASIGVVLASPLSIVVASNVGVTDGAFDGT